MTDRRQVDVAIIGAGSAGMRAYREVTKHTDSVLLIENHTYGTTCARVGCMPSKLLIAAAEAAHLATHADPFGVHYDNVTINGREVMDRVRFERDRFVGFVIEDVEGWKAEHRIMGTAKFVSDHILDVDGVEVEAKRVIIASGSRPNIIPPFKDFGDRLIVNDDIFDWEDLPDSVAVFGAGVIGLELGQALARLGVRVSLFGRDHMVGPLTDPTVIEAGTAIFQEEIDFHPHGEVTKRENTDDGVSITYVHEGKEHTVRFDYALAAAGRRPNIDGIGLENTSLTLDARGMPSFNLHSGQIEDSHIFIAGDVNGKFPLLHEASDEGQIAGYNAAHYPSVRNFKKSAPIGVMFTDPQIMMVGQTFKELSENGSEFECGEVDFKGQGRSRVMLMNKGILRVYGEHMTGKFLGAEMIGPRAEHLAHLLAWSYQSGLTIAEMLERPFYHPVVEEGLRTALRDLNFKLKMGEQPPARCLDCGPGG